MDLHHRSNRGAAEADFAHATTRAAVDFARADRAALAVTAAAMVVGAASVEDANPEVQALAHRPVRTPASSTR